MRFVTYSAVPNFPPEDQFGPDAVRTQIGNLWVDHIDGVPTADDIAARFVVPDPIPDVQTQIDAIKAVLVAKNVVTDADMAAVQSAQVDALT